MTNTCKALHPLYTDKKDNLSMVFRCQSTTAVLSWKGAQSMEIPPRHEQATPPGVSEGFSKHMALELVPHLLVILDLGF